MKATGRVNRRQYQEAADDLEHARRAEQRSELHVVESIDMRKTKELCGAML
jgi:hypothetical protein